MRTHFVTFALFGLLGIGECVFAKTINLPITSIETAVENAKQYVASKNIDLTDAFIGIVEFHNLHNEYERPYWRVRWVRKTGGKGAWFEVKLYSDGSVQELHGK